MPTKGTMPRLCDVCGTPFFAQLSEVNRGMGRYCNRTCGGIGRRGSDFTPDDIFEANADRSGVCWPWTGELGGGYGSSQRGRIRYRTKTGRVEISAPVYAWWKATGHWPTKGEYVCHDCPSGDNPLCVRNDKAGTYTVRDVEYERHGHLWLGTHEANVFDMIDKGRHVRGERVGGARLTADMVREIRAKYAAGGMTHEQIGVEYGMQRAAITGIINRRSWRHV